MTANLLLTIQALAIILLSFTVNNHTKTLRKIYQKIDNVEDHLLLTRLNLYEHIGQDDIHNT